MIFMLYFGVDDSNIELSDFKNIDNATLNISNERENVFVSFSDDSIDYFMNGNEEVITIIPDLEIKREWLGKLLKKYQTSLLEKDYNVYVRVRDFYETDINRIKNCKNISAIEIDSLDYDLKTIISGYTEKKDE